MKCEAQSPQSYTITVINVTTFSQDNDDYFLYFINISLFASRFTPCTLLLFSFIYLFGTCKQHT